MWSLLRRNRALRRIVAYQVLAGLQMGTFGLLLNLYLLALGHREDLIGFIASANTLALSFMALAAGRIVQRFGLDRTLIAGFLLATLASAGQALSTQAFMLVAFAILIGMGLAMMQSLQMPFLANHLAQAELPIGSALISAIATLASTIGILLGGLLPTLLSSTTSLSVVARQRTTLLVAVVVGLLGLLPLLSLRRADQAQPALGTMMGAPPSDHLHTRTRRIIQQYAGATALISLGAGAFLPFVNVYLARLGANPGEIGGLLSLVGIIGSVGGLVSPTLSQLVGRERFSVFARVAPVLPAFLLIGLPSIPMVVLTYGARQIGAGLTWPIEASILNTRVPPRARPGAFGLRTAAWNISWALSSALTGQLIVHGGYRLPLVILIISTILGGIVLSVVLRPTPEERAKPQAGPA